MGRTVVVGLVMLLFAFAAAAQESLTLLKIKETGVISLGYRDGSIPFSYLDDKRRPIGYSMDLCMRVVEAVKAYLKLPDLQIRLVAVTSATRMPLIANNIVDLECGTTTNTAARQKQVGFAVTTYIASARLLTRRDADVKSLQDLHGRTVVSTAGTTSIRRLIELNAAQGLDMDIIAVKDHAEGFRLVENGRALAFVMDDVLLHGFVAMSSRPSAFVVTGEALSIEPYGIALRNNDPGFKRLVDDTLVGLFRSGEARQIYDRWFMSPIPPRQINLNLPMSPALVRVIAHPTDSGEPADYQR